jgi:DNA-binding CsgD family transcriptional regulator
VLTQREFQILELIERGLSNKEIAATLTIELATVKNHVHNILAKLGVRRRMDAVIRARPAVATESTGALPGLEQGAAAVHLSAETHDSSGTGVASA